LLVQFLNLPDILSAVDNVVVELIPKGYGCQLGAGEEGDGREVETVDYSVKGEESTAHYDPDED
jgi:hypothetical protein